MNASTLAIGALIWTTNNMVTAQHNKWRDAAIAHGVSVNVHGCNEPCQPATRVLLARLPGHAFAKSPWQPGVLKWHQMLLAPMLNSVCVLEERI
jgi:hypothetical protein